MYTIKQSIITPDKVLISIKKYWYVSYFSTKHVVDTHYNMSPWRNKNKSTGNNATCPTTVLTSSKCHLQCSKGCNSKGRLTSYGSYVVHVFSRCFCERFHENISNSFQLTIHGGNGYMQCSKGNNSKSRQTRVTVHVFCTLPQSALYLCEVSWISWTVSELWSGQEYMVEMAIFNIYNVQRAVTPKVG